MNLSAKITPKNLDLGLWYFSLKKYALTGSPPVDAPGVIVLKNTPEIRIKKL